ncbi:hypothetical protein B0A48_12914 [Cryoendolithus antarcticus]|uniref:Uncharacterized protein n=1 Tax=Cryoendolithus antarcticus TaxID=1507870 RepID=A0A1V8SQJ1_9PEZI|nr:hypothetical protein B0A48_12914 [Cryoendolithus antarcticus]
MPRAPTDATRFTSTSPHMSAAPPSSTFAANPSPSFASSTAIPAGSQIQFGSSPPQNETPQQKISRLRSAAAANRRIKLSTFDRVVITGRVVADKAHRYTAIGLIGATVITGVVATAGITDMLLHNRRRRNEWLAEQQAKTRVETMAAREAEKEGRASEDQMLLINRERAAEEAAEIRRTRPGILKRINKSLFGGLDQEEQKGGRMGAAMTGRPALEPIADAGSNVIKPDGVHVVEVEDPSLGQNEDLGVLKAVEENVESHRRAGDTVEVKVRPTGEPLLREAQAESDVPPKKAQTWTEWLTGR